MTKLIKFPDTPSWVEIDLSALVHNLKQVRALVSPKTKIMGVVKANAYGHGAVGISRCLIENGADLLGVAFFSEAMELREAGIAAPLIIMSGVIGSEQVPLAIKNDIQLAVYSKDMAGIISMAALETGRAAKVHIKIDTGMARLGIPPEHALEFMETIDKLGGIEIVGLFSHFACAEENPAITMRQYKILREIIDIARAKKYNIQYAHISNSAAVMNYPQMDMDMVRPGLMLYGIYPNPKVQLKPVLSLKSGIVFLKKAARGTSISYGHTYTADTEKLIATIPIGYADGFNRLLSNRGEVLVNGVRVPVVGRICMDLSMLDVTNVPGVKTGDPVTIIGKDGNQEITVEEIAGRLGTIPYEVTCSIGQRVRRVCL